MNYQKTVITATHLMVAYHVFACHGLPYGGFANLREVEKGKVGYILAVGQIVESYRYTEENRTLGFHVRIDGISDKGVVFSEHKFHHEQIDGEWQNWTEWVNPVLRPWVKETILCSGKKVQSDLYIQPCDELYEKPYINELVEGTVQHDGGIWYHNGERSTYSQFAENLKNFVLM